MPRQGLNRRRVLEAALKIVDDGGLADLTMRNLAQQLGIEAPSLYKHVDGKPDILDVITSLIYEEIEFTGITGSFRERVLAYGDAFRRALLAHPNAVELLAMRTLPRESTIDLVETALSELANLGFPPTEGRRYVNVAVGFIVGHVLAEVGSRQLGLEELLAARRQFDDPRYPHARLLALEPVDYDAEFQLGIGLIVDAIERKAAALVG